MEAIRFETTIEREGTIGVPGVHVGDEVEVIVLLKAARPKAYALRGSGSRYDHPFEPAIPESDWEQSA